ncbi:MAG: hypothetical protein ACU0B1_04770 [Thermohalobaculum sp.]
MDGMQMAERVPESGLAGLILELECELSRLRSATGLLHVVAASEIKPEPGDLSVLADVFGDIAGRLAECHGRLHAAGRTAPVVMQP